MSDEQRMREQKRRDFRRGAVIVGVLFVMSPLFWIPAYLVVADVGESTGWWTERDMLRGATKN